ncbi:pyruvate:ferredoxin (flavodoxin) oxidoreductase [Haliovirga abyssi]|uniref:Pyruvate-flavodoxin oxidoreductase n=1 Tax=Haliovirga abyssi TaxID=2996794 RepID=A0AAU9DFA9_9FUSO|nr:pyruvate:ferredoxin (flavodoxin) oxidoreductase [Haliovirga abyssi]BDU50888.1 pyruvate-flavodoxin oxidoreductase [Haliovirga abyssi]
MAKQMKTMDGNMAAAHVSYAFTETAGIYPITPSSPMAEYTDEWGAHGRKNIFGTTVKLVEMQSEAGASGAVHGALQAGALTTTYTASQGLLLMVPNMYKIAGELLPGVFHVSARNIATHALSIFGEHSDVYATRQTGFAMLASGGVQEVMDLGAVAHLAAIKGRVPFLHFFDGFRTSHEIQKVEAWDYDDLAKLVDYDAIKEFKARALNPEHPVTRGTAQNPDIYFQAREASNKYYDAVPDIVAEYMKEISKLTGREYKPYNYYGAADAERVIIAMGSVTETIKETVDYLMAKGEKVGVISVHLYRPFSKKYFMEVLPSTVKSIAVLDRSKEPGALGEALYLDVRALFYDEEVKPTIVGGRYGLSSKDTTPSQIVEVYKNLDRSEPKNQFTIGIVDDVTFTSLPLGDEIDTVPEGTVECKFFGLGSDGTVGANKNSIKIIGDNTDMYAQGYFSYDSKKSGGSTVSHLRFGKKPITSIYLVNHPDFVSCSVPAYLGQYDLLKGIKKGGTFLLNSIWDAEETLKRLPNNLKKELAEKEVNFYIINATKIAEEIGLGHRTNTIMQSAFFKLAEVVPFADAVEYLKSAIVKSYGKKGEDIVKMNYAAVEKGGEELVKVEVKPEWKDLVVDKKEVVASNISDPTLANFVEKIAKPINKLEGDDLPVSLFADAADGTMPNGSCAFEKRGIAVSVPEWNVDNCIQCNQCAYVCPHAVIRPFLLDEKEMANAPEGLETKKPLGKGFDGLQYKIQVSVMDCTGCGSCANVCPAPNKALVMKPLDTQRDEAKNWDYLANNVTYKDKIMDKKSSVKASQFAQPLFEFSGACAGCGETPYIKLITQLFGDRMMVANATGCSSIYGGSAPSTPYCKNAEGQGPAWANSLFEDNAEYGIGMAMGVEKQRDMIAETMTSNMDTVSAEMQEAFKAWIDGMHDADASKEASAKLTEVLEKDGTELAKTLLEAKQHFVKKSVWIFGGDGWAYDIGFGGVDHALASGMDVNVLVVDTEVYSNTGGQASKASVTGQVAKFAASGKPIRKKDLGKIAMSYGYVYVAQVAMGANQAQYLKAIREAEAYPGPSIVIAYAPCINHGIRKGMGKSQLEEKLAVESGYWHLYRFNPELEAAGKNPFQLDSKEPNWDKYLEYLNGEVRFTSLMKTFPEKVDVLFAQSLEDAKWRYNSYRRLAEIDYTK